MLLTEDDAKTKWCPEVRFQALANSGHGSMAPIGAVNRMPGGRPTPTAGGTDYPDNPLPARCIASRCAAWRALPDGRGWCGKFGPPPGINTFNLGTMQ